MGIGDAKLYISDVSIASIGFDSRRNSSNLHYPAELDLDGRRLNHVSLKPLQHTSMSRCSPSTLKRSAGTLDAAERPSCNIAQNASGVVASCGNLTLRPIMASASVGSLSVFIAQIEHMWLRSVFYSIVTGTDREGTLKEGKAAEATLRVWIMWRVLMKPRTFARLILLHIRVAGH